MSFFGFGIFGKKVTEVSFTHCTEQVTPNFDVFHYCRGSLEKPGEPGVVTTSAFTTHFSCVICKYFIRKYCETINVPFPKKSLRNVFILINININTFIFLDSCFTHWVAMLSFFNVQSIPNLARGRPFKVASMFIIIL